MKLIVMLAIGAVGIAGIISLVLGLLFKAKSLARGGICAVVLAAGGGIAAALFFTPPKPDKRDRKPESTLVEVMRAAPGRQRVRIVALGTVVPARQVELQSEVSGRVVEQSPNLVPGGIFPAGGVLVRVDARDYQTALEKQRALLADAEFNLKVEEGRRAIAKREWELLEKELDTAGARRDLALREPHLARAKAALAAAGSALGQAELNLKRTAIAAPFNALVKEETVELGQLVGPASRLATLIGTDRFWVRVSVPVDRLKWIKLPDAAGAGGSAARVIQECGGGRRVERSGRVVRLLGDLEPAGRLARVLIEVEDPLGLKAGGEKPAVPLLLGAYVRTVIEGIEVDNVIAISQSALRDGNKVWVMAPDDTLDIREVKTVWRGRDTVYVGSGLRAGDRVVTSDLASAARDMALRVPTDKDRKPGKSRGKPPKPGVKR